MKSRLALLLIFWCSLAIPTLAETWVDTETWDDLNVTRINNSSAPQTQLSLDVKAVFKVPTLDPNKYLISSISLKFTDELGAGEWGYPILDYYQNHLAVQVDAPDRSGLISSTTQDFIQESGISGHVIVQHFNSTPTNGNVTASHYQTGSSYDEGNYVPISMDISSFGQGSAGTGPPQYQHYASDMLLFINPPELAITYTFTLLNGATLADLPSSNSPDLPYISSDSVPDPNASFPTDFPSYVVQPVPEPTGLGLMFVGTGMILGKLALRRRANSQVV